MTRQTLLAEAAHLLSQRPDVAALPITREYLDGQIVRTVARAAAITNDLRLDGDGAVHLITFEDGEEIDSEFLGSAEDGSARRGVRRECPELVERLYTLEDEWSDREHEADDRASWEAEFRAAKGF